MGDPRDHDEDSARARMGRLILALRSQGIVDP